MNLLIVEDDQKIAAYVAKGLREAGYTVDIANNGENGLQMATVSPYDAAIIDLMLPGMDGLSLIQELRAQQVKTPLLILSARRSVDDRVRGLRTGGDDYLTKPFAFSELLARVQALVRRGSDTPEATTLSIHGITMNLLTREVRRDQKVLQLHQREFSLLEYLLRHPQHVVSKTTILEHVYGYNFDPQTNVVDVLVCRLRAKVDRGFEKPLIHTVRGAGYVLKGD